MPPKKPVQPIVQGGILLIGASAVCAEVAWAHMRGLAQTYGVICGARADLLAHCPACYASVALFVAGLAAFAAARADLPARLAKARARPPGP